MFYHYCKVRLALGERLRKVQKVQIRHSAPVSRQNKQFGAAGRLKFCVMCGVSPYKKLTGAPSCANLYILCFVLCVKRVHDWPKGFTAWQCLMELRVWLNCGCTRTARSLAIEFSFMAAACSISSALRDGGPCGLNAE